MIFTMSYCILGMTLLSMCMSLMQEQIVDKVSWMIHELSGESDSEEVVKISKEGKVNETPADKTGNELNFNETRKKKDDEVELFDKDEVNHTDDEGVDLGEDNEAFEKDDANHSDDEGVDLGEDNE